MSSQNTYSGDVYRTSGGQCIGCPYHAPQMVYYGTARITFSDSMTASITINGVTVNVQREQFGIDLSNVATPLLGEWATTDGTSLFPVYFAERITFPRAQVLNNVVTATGSMTGAASRLAVGGFVSGRWGILLDSSTSYYDLYTFTFCGFNRIEGSDYTYPKGSSPSGSMPFFAHRIKSAAAAAGLDAPGTGKRLQMQSAAALWHVEDVAVSKVGMAGGERAATPDEVLQIQQMARVLEQALEAAQVSTQ